MGYRLPERTARLVFEEPFVGAEVVVRLDVSFGTYLDITTRFAGARGINEAQDVDTVLTIAGDVEAIMKDFSTKVLREWNIEDDEGKPVPIHPDGLLNIPLDFAMRIIEVWSEAAADSPLATARSNSSMPSVNGGGRARVRSSRRR